MKTLLVHLSDLHIKTPRDPILARGTAISAALRNIEADVKAIVCVISGDIAFSGAEDEYQMALDFLCVIQAEIEKEFPHLKCLFLMVPGNHDCDFRDSMAVRGSVIPRVLEAPDLLKEESHAAICLDPLKRFFDFRSAFEQVPLGDNNSPNPKIYSEHTLDVGDGKITFLCYNTAILSTIHEQPGSLLYPTAYIPTTRPNDVAVISVLHHPSNWLEPNCARQFRNKIEGISDIIITGHEHVLDSRDVSSSHGDASYLEGGALQENSDPNISEFNVLIVDTRACFKIDGVEPEHNRRGKQKP